MTTMSSRLKKARDIVSNLESERQPHDEKFKEITEWLLPHRGFWPGDGDSDKSVLSRGRKLINPAATLSCKRSAGGLTAGMTPETQPWIKLRHRDRNIQEAMGVRDYIGQVEALIRRLLQVGGFYQAIHQGNQEYIGFANMLIFMDRSPKTLARFEACTAGTYCVAHDADGNLVTVVRRLRYTVKQLGDKYGKEKLSRSSQNAYEKTPYKKIDCVHVVTKRKTYDPTKIDFKNMPFESLLYEEAENKANVSDVLSESGYAEMPYFFTGWDKTGDSPYCVGPGHDSIGHSKQLQELERQKLIALQKKINPPMKKPIGMKGRLNTAPGSETSVSHTEPNGISPLYEVNVNLNEIRQEINEVELRLGSTLLADLFYDLPAEMRPNDMTLGEYMGRKRERLQMMAPTLSSYEPEILDGIIARAFGMLDRANLLPPPPPAMGEASLIDVEYVSIIAQALKQDGGQTTRAVVLEVRELAALQRESGRKPTVIDKIDLDQCVDEIVDSYGAPGRILRDDETVAEMRKAEAAAEAEQAQSANQLAMAEAMSKIGSQSTGADTVAGDLMGKGE